MKKTRNRDALIQNATHTHTHTYTCMDLCTQTCNIHFEEKNNTKHAISILHTEFTQNEITFTRTTYIPHIAKKKNIFRRKGQTVQETVYTCM